ncbi:MAG TPA: hypothetical protein VFP38_11365, partial [Bradyrhizobium sp.]|nr:hypothetical protein [Bradyrhizobium sp.]
AHAVLHFTRLQCWWGHQANRAWIRRRGPALRRRRRGKSIGRTLGIEENGPSIHLYANNEPVPRLVKVT